jgi:hypothetical protein
MRTFKIQRIDNKDEYYEIEGHALNSSDGNITIIRNSQAVGVFPIPYYFALLVKENDEENK